MGMFKGWWKVRVGGLAVLSILSLFLPLMEAKAATAAPVKLAWAASTDPDVDGYAVYYGPVNSTLARLDVGATLQAVVPNLTANTSYSFYVVAYAADGAESVPSNQVQYRPPVLTKVQVVRNQSGTVNVQFRAPAGATCRVQYTASLNPSNWQNLGSAIAAADGTVAFNDPGASSSPMRFYRAVYP
jgi:hypothetical protein